MPATERESVRLEAFSDGVFAIAITLLILEIQVPKLAPGASNRELLHALLALWPSYVALLGSFFAILIMWVNHHGFFKLLNHVSRKLFFANGFLLLLITFVPFSTAVLASYLNQRSINTAAALYCGTYVLINIAYNALWFAAASRPCLFRSDIPTHNLLRVRNAYLIAFPIYLFATLISLYNAYAGLFIALSLWVLWARLGYME